MSQTIKSKYVVTDGSFVWTAKTRQQAEKKAKDLAKSLKATTWVCINYKSKPGLKTINRFDP